MSSFAVCSVWLVMIGNIGKGAYLWIRVDITGNVNHLLDGCPNNCGLCHTRWRICRDHKNVDLITNLNDIKKALFMNNNKLEEP